jgi:hypothetical protein
MKNAPTYWGGRAVSLLTATVPQGRPELTRRLNRRDADLTLSNPEGIVESVKSNRNQTRSDQKMKPISRPDHCHPQVVDSGHKRLWTINRRPLANVAAIASRFYQTNPSQKFITHYQSNGTTNHVSVFLQKRTHISPKSNPTPAFMHNVPPPI